MVQVVDIRSARRKLGLSQEQLAEALGVSRNTIGRWERGECDPGMDKLAELERTLARLQEGPASPEGTHTPKADTPLPDTPVPKGAEPPPPVVPASKEAEPPPVVQTKARRWPAALICAGVYSISQRLVPWNVVPAEKIEGEGVDEILSVVPPHIVPL